MNGGRERPARSSEFTLRSPPVIALAYFAGPLIGLTAYWAWSVAGALLHSAADVDLAAVGNLWFLIVFFGGAACLLVEILVVTPLLIGFSRRQWSWMNLWTALVIGFACGALPYLLLSMAADAPGSGSSYSVGGVDLVVNGRRTLSGWLQVLRDAAMMGAVGVISAGVFRLIAIRRT